MYHKRKQGPDNVLFDEYSRSLPIKDRIKTLRAIADACDVQLRTVQRWREYGPIRQSFKEIIEKTAGQSLFGYKTINQAIDALEPAAIKGNQKAVKMINALVMQRIEQGGKTKI